jgi:hypothetical protein
MKMDEITFSVYSSSNYSDYIEPEKPPESDEDKINRLAEEVERFKKGYAASDKRWRDTRDELEILQKECEWIPTTTKYPENPIPTGFALVCYCFKDGFMGSVYISEDSGKIWERNGDGEYDNEIKDVLLWKFIRLPEFNK